MEQLVNNSIKYSNEEQARIRQGFKDWRTIAEDHSKRYLIDSSSMTKLSSFIEEIMQDDNLSKYATLLETRAVKLLCTMIEAWANISINIPEFDIDIERLLEYSKLQESMEPIIIEVISLFQLNPDCKDLFEILQIIFDPTNNLYKLFKHKEPIRKALEENKQAQWRHRLKVGDRVDAVIGNSSWNNWGPAIITFIYNDVIQVQFEDAPKKYDRSIYRFSSHLDQYGSHSKHYNWKRGIQRGDIICKIRFKNSDREDQDVMDVKEYFDPDGRSYTFVAIRTREYTHYESGISRYDRRNRVSSYSRNEYYHSLWIPRISKSQIDIYSNSQNIYSETRNTNMNRLESEISKYENSYQNNPIQQYTSYMFNEVLNYFQNEWDFGDIIIENATNREFDYWTQKEKYLKWILTVSDLYDYGFFEKNLAKINEARDIAISKAFDYNVNMTHRYNLYDMIDTLDQLIDRAFSIKTKDIESKDLYLKVLSFHLDFDATLLSEQFWDKYFEYLDVSSKLSKVHASKWVGDDWRNKCKAIESIFGKSNSGNIHIKFWRVQTLKFLLSEKFENEEQVHMFVKVINMTKHSTYSSDLNFRDEFKWIPHTGRVLLARKFKDGSFDANNEIELDCFVALAEYSLCNQSDIKKATDWCWERIRETTDLNFAFSDLYYKKTMSSLLDLISIESSLAKSYIYKSIKLLRTKVPKSIVNKVLHGMLNILISSQNTTEVQNSVQQQEDEESKTEVNIEKYLISWDDANKVRTADFISDLIKKGELIRLFLEDIKSCLNDQKSENCTDEEKFEDINLVLEMLDLFAKNSLFKLSKNELDLVYEIWLEEPQSSSTREFLLDWLMEISGFQSQKTQKSIMEIINELHNNSPLKLYRIT